MSYIVNLPSKIREKIKNYYTELYYKFRKRYPNDRSYTHKQLLSNIRNATSINKTSIEDIDIKQPIYQPWLNEGWKEIRANNWHYAIKLVIMKNGEQIQAIVQDAHHKNDNHNDTMQTNPYESKALGKVLDLIRRMRNIL